MRMVAGTRNNRSPSRVPRYASEVPCRPLLGAAEPPDAGWTWNGTSPLVHTSWAPGKPDDADGVEDGMEQCGTIRPGGWDDDNCNQMLPFFCERP